jgi:hypothetical protein
MAGLCMCQRSGGRRAIDRRKVRLPRDSKWPPQIIAPLGVHRFRGAQRAPVLLVRFPTPQEDDGQRIDPHDHSEAGIGGDATNCAVG